MASVIFMSFVMSFCPLQYEVSFLQSDLASSNARSNYSQILHLLIFFLVCKKSDLIWPMNSQFSPVSYRENVPCSFSRNILAWKRHILQF